MISFRSCHLARPSWNRGADIRRTIPADRRAHQPQKQDGPGFVETNPGPSLIQRAHSGSRRISLHAEPMREPRGHALGADASRTGTRPRENRAEPGRPIHGPRNDPFLVRDSQAMSAPPDRTWGDQREDGGKKGALSSRMWNQIPRRLVDAACSCRRPKYDDTGPSSTLSPAFLGKFSRRRPCADRRKEKGERRQRPAPCGS